MEIGGFNVDQISGLLVGGILGAIVGGLAAIGIIIQIVLAVLNLIGCWKIYNKFGEPGWKCLIPFYESWVEYKHTWKPVMAIPVWVLGFCCEFAMEYVAEGSAAWTVLAIAAFVGWIISIIGYHKLSKAFGHGVGFTIGLILIPSIFVIILGLGKSKYIGNTSAGTAAGTPAAEDGSESR